jgi:hypothetical protein
MNLSSTGIDAHRRVDGTRYLRGVGDQSMMNCTSATVIAASSASQARWAGSHHPPTLGPSLGGGTCSRGAGGGTFPFRSAGFPNRPKALTAATASKERA